jgi:hypothetical protein
MIALSVIRSDYIIGFWAMIVTMVIGGVLSFIIDVFFGD